MSAKESWLSMQPTHIASFHIRVDMNRVQHRVPQYAQLGAFTKLQQQSTPDARKCVLLAAAAAAAHNAFSILSLVIRSPSTKRENYAPPMVLYKKKNA
jgi:hypothetical protein